MALTMALLFGGILFFFFGYRIYARLIEKSIVKPDPNALTPAYQKYDGLDYIPAKVPLLWGHHFSNIAGAGPILGPLVAVAAFGWAPTLLWVLLGAVFCGAVHDYLVLCVSMKNGGVSIATVAQTTLGKRAKLILSLFLFLSLILIIAVFAVTSAQTIVEKPELVIPTFGIIPLALFLGLCVYKLRMRLLPISIIATLLMCLLIYLGVKFPLEVPKNFLGLGAAFFWTLIFFIYGLSASILPVGYLDQPRDYISTVILFLGVGLGLVSLVFAHPPMSAPAFISFSSPSQGPLWPMLFVLVACGAISGFHSLVSGGTTAKQLPNEKYQKTVGYGAMLAEGIVALLSALLVSAGLYWSSVPDTEANSYNLPTLLKEKGWIFTFGTAYGRVVSQAFSFIPFAIASVFAMLMLNAFVLTTLDTAVRLGRYIIQESAGETISLLKNRTLTSFIVVIPAFILTLTNTWQAMWPIFGAANQLIAALALLVVTAYLSYAKKPTKFSLVPGIFITLTTIAALVYKVNEYLLGEKKQLLLGVTAILLIILAVLVLFETIHCMRKLYQNRHKKPFSQDSVP
ncbi:MAG: carbon starvation protein A [Planctomycetota bacterium]|nr:carbon starvation protein A [Planctomycetota bacterium]